MWIIILAVVIVVAFFFAAIIIKNYVENTWPPLGRFVNLDGTQIHYFDVAPELDADLPPIVFLHGANGNLRDQMYTLRPLLEGRARLIFMDRPGCGYSTRINQDYSSPKLQSKVIAALLDHLEIDKAIICGHSLGGAVSAAFGVCYPEKTAGLMFLAPATHPWPTDLYWYYNLANVPLVGRLFCELFAPLLGWLKYRQTIKSVFHPNLVPADYDSESGVKLALRGRQFFNNAMDVVNLKTNVTEICGQYKNINCPVVIITGDSDDIVMAEIHSYGLKRDIDEAWLIVVPNIGHKPDVYCLQEILRGIEMIAHKSSTRPDKEILNIN